MQTLEKTLKQSHDWALDRIHFLCENKDYENAYSVRIEFCEWLDPQIEEHDIVSLEYIGEQEDDTRSS